MTKPNRTAFVAMKFSDDHWNDRRYQIIQEVLEEANYISLRADQIRSSGPVVDEVCRLLKESDLVVIDSSGDSHSVSYEIGFCHGLERPAETVLLLRDDSEMPFNYRHYRHRVYRDLRHLRRLLRDYLKLSVPVPDDQLGYAYTFEFTEGSHDYILRAANFVFKALEAKKFSGRCECYGGEYFMLRGRICGVGIFLRSARKPFWPSLEFWDSIAKQVAAMASGTDLLFDERSSELGTKGGIRAHLVHCGTAEFDKGKIIHILGSEAEGNFFSSHKIGNGT